MSPKQISYPDLDYCTILINLSPFCDCDTPDKNFCLSLCPEACDMGKISSGTAPCLAILAVLGVEFEAAVHSRNQNWCFVTENLKFWQNLPRSL
jgi:hypothetical protein